MPAWSPGTVRLFASHLSAHKVHVAAVTEALGDYGVSSFVAHEAIEVSLPWREEIAVGLREADCMVVFCHEGFHSSDWTDQEVGWAMGREIPVVVVWYGVEKLRGFLEQFQAIVVSPHTTTAEIAQQVFEALLASPTIRDKVIDGLISALGTAGSYTSAKVSAEALRSIADELRRSDLLAILHQFRKNDQVHGAVIARKPIRSLVEQRAPDMLTDFFPAG